MDNNIYVYIVDLPDQIDEMVTPCLDGFTVYLNSKLTYTGRVRAYCHAINHIEGNDWRKEDSNEIELSAHRRES